MAWGHILTQPKHRNPLYFIKKGLFDKKLYFWKIIFSQKMFSHAIKHLLKHLLQIEMLKCPMNMW